MFRTLTDRILVSPQISVEQVAEAKAQGVTMIVNNRPDNEEPGQVNGAEIEAAALEMCQDSALATACPLHA